MNQPLRILHLEDNPADSQLLGDQLAHEGIAAKVSLTTGRADFVAALEKEKWDLIIADYRLPDFTGLDALKLVRDKLPVTPFILLSGTIGELAAIESLKAGATDYVLKQNRERLPSSILRAVAEAAERGGANWPRPTCARAKNNTVCCSRAIRIRCGFLTWRRWSFSKSTSRPSTIMVSAARNFWP